MTKKFYITTAIPYANGPPHIGFALEIVQADVLARWKRLNGYDVFFLTGTDEHGTKNYQTAKKQGLTTQEFVDKNSSYFKELTKVLNISNNYFIKTTDQKIHWPGVVEMWKKLEKKGDIYKKKYEGDYCSGCERFITEKELVDGKCPNHPKLKIQNISEENYFFKLSKYSNKIKELIQKDKLVIKPLKWKNNFLGLIKNGLADVSFSRSKKNLPWGIPVPGDDSQVMYVWCDALTNYLTGIGFPKKKYEKYWPADIHLVGKDMLRFHTGIWPGMLLSAGIPLPKEVIVHGFLTVGGRKMSKSTGNVISPLELVKKYPADSIRYSLMRATPFGDDGDFSEQALLNRHNDELANKLGNLVSRVSTLIEKYDIEKCELITDIQQESLKRISQEIRNSDKTEIRGKIVKAKTREGYTGRISLDFFKPGNVKLLKILQGREVSKGKPFINYLGRIISLLVEKLFENYELDKVLNEIFAFVDICNEYVQNKKPWETKDKKVLFELKESILEIAKLLLPFIPESAEKIIKQFSAKNIKKGEILFKKIIN